MCGLTGYLLKNETESDSSTVLDMLALQRHRGPDDSGILGINIHNNNLEELEVKEPLPFNIKPNLIFGFNRLSILDLSPAGHQPMIHQASKVALMMNGEVYNAFDYKPELIDMGFSFKGNSDTEVVLYLYLAFGLEGMLERLNGMYALAIYDGRSKDLYLIRDRMGIKPLYVLHESGRIVFSSEMKSFKALPDFKFQLDEQQLSEFLLFRNSINNTLFQNIVNITPGTYWKINSAGEIQVNTYYNIRKEGEAKADPLYREKLGQALRNAVKRQMISDVKLGCQLSGGVDSSLVTAFAAETLPKGALETVSIVFKERHFSEKIFIDQVADQYALQSHQFTLDAKAYLDLIDEAVWHFEQPLNHPNTIGIKLLSREARKHVTVLLSGEGADEALAGYSRFLPNHALFFSKNTLMKALKSRRALVEFISVWTDNAQRYLMQTAFGGFGTALSLYPKFSVKQALKGRKEIWDSIEDSPGRKKRKYELLTYLPDLLMRQDKMSMAHTIENRVPFLDNQMIAAALQIPDSELIQFKNGIWEGKVLLKDLCAVIFGKDFAYRDKMGFGIPLKSFFSSADFLKKWNASYLPGIEKRGLFQVKSLKKWVNQPLKMNTEQLDALWLMVGFEIWAKQYLD